MLTDLLAMHEVHNASGLFMVILTLHLTQHLEVTHLVLWGIVLYVPELSLCLNWREVKLWELEFLLLDAAADV